MAVFEAGRGRGRTEPVVFVPFIRKQTYSWKSSSRVGSHHSEEAFQLLKQEEEESQGWKQSLAQPVGPLCPKEHGTTMACWNIDIFCPSFRACPWMMDSVLVSHVCVCPQGLNRNSRRERVRVIKMRYL